MKSKTFSIVIMLLIIFSAFASYAQIEGFYPESNKYALASGVGVFGVSCSNLKSTSIRDSILIKPTLNTDLLALSDTSSTSSNIIDSCYFIVIDSMDQYSYELWCVSISTNEKFLILFDTFFYLNEINFIGYFYLQLLVKKENEIYDSSSHYFQMWEVQSIKPEELSLHKYDFSIKSQCKASSVLVYYTLSESALASLVVYSCKGQVMREILNNFTCAGTHTHLLDTEGFSSGPYLIKFTSNEQSVVKKFSLFK